VILVGVLAFAVLLRRVEPLVLPEDRPVSTVGA
jgi:hypothetical protein